MYIYIYDIIVYKIVYIYVIHVIFCFSALLALQNSSEFGSLGSQPRQSVSSVEFASLHCSELEGMTRCQTTQCSSMLTHRSGLFASLLKTRLCSNFLLRKLQPLHFSLICRWNCQGLAWQGILQHPFTNNQYKTLASVLRLDHVLEWGRRMHECSLQQV